MIGRSVGLTALTVTSLVACETDARILPEITERDGHTVATLPSVPPPDDASYLWELRVVREVATAPSPDVEPSVYIPTIVLPLSTGELVVHDDVSEGRLVVLDPDDGRVLARFGRSGSGPGELGPSLYLSEGPGGEIVVLDRVNRQHHRFERDGTWLGSDPAAREGGGGRVMRHPTRPGYLLSVYQESGESWHRSLIHWSPGASSEHLLRLPEPAADARPGGIQQGRPLWTVVGDDLVTMWSSRPVVLVHGPEGRLRREIVLPWSVRELTEREVQEQAERVGALASILSSGRIALTNEFYTVNDSVFGMFQSSMWRPAGDPPIPVGARIWRLFSTSGAYLGALELPDDFLPLGLAAGTLWVRVLDDMAVPVLQEVEVVPKGSYQG